MAAATVEPFSSDLYIDSHNSSRTLGTSCYQIQTKNSDYQIQTKNSDIQSCPGQELDLSLYGSAWHNLDTSSYTPSPTPNRKKRCRDEECDIISRTDNLGTNLTLEEITTIVNNFEDKVDTSHGDDYSNASDCDAMSMGSPVKRRSTSPNRSVTYGNVICRTFSSDEDDCGLQQDSSVGVKIHDGPSISSYIASDLIVKFFETNELKDPASVNRTVKALSNTQDEHHDTITCSSALFRQIGERFDSIVDALCSGQKHVGILPSNVKLGKQYKDDLSRLRNLVAEASDLKVVR